MGFNHAHLLEFSSFGKEARSLPIKSLFEAVLWITRSGACWEDLSRHSLKLVLFRKTAGRIVYD